MSEKIDVYKRQGDGRGVDNGDSRVPVIEETLYAFSLAAVRAFDGCLLEESDVQDDKAAMMDLVYDPEKNPEVLKSQMCIRDSSFYNAAGCINMKPADLKSRNSASVFP